MNEVVLQYINILCVVGCLNFTNRPDILILDYYWFNSFRNL